jgi:hypothetical protein
MGPRARSRLARGVIGLAVIAAAIVAATLLTKQSGSGSRAGPRAGGHVVGKTDTRYYKNSTKLTFGMTKQQVLRLVGPPTKSVGRCWQYDINVEYPANGKRADFVWNADRMCFDGGRYSDLHEEMNGRWDHRAPFPASSGS